MEEQETISLLFSQRAANDHGSVFAEVPDGAGGTREIEYTAAGSPDGYYWDDKEILWTGPKEDCRLAVRKGRRGIGIEHY